MLPLPFRDFVSPRVALRLRKVNLNIALGMVVAFEVFLQAILEDDEALRGTYTKLIFAYLSAHCISGEKLTLLMCKLSCRQYYLMRTVGMEPPLWRGCNNQDIETVKCLLCLDGMRDDPASDGTTGFALSLAQLNTEQTLSILESRIEPRDEILFLAQEFILVETSDTVMLSLQAEVRTYLEGILEPISVMIHSEDPIDERYTIVRKVLWP